MPPKRYINDVSNVSGSVKAVKDYKIKNKKIITVIQKLLKENIHLFVRLHDLICKFCHL
jgi:hypothetical protein